MDNIESPKIDITAIHDVNGSGLQCDQVQCEGTTHFTYASDERRLSRFAYFASGSVV